MKTLVIHPNDPSTDFLMYIYSGIECDLLCDYDISEYVVARCISEYDRIICLGHGCSDGLLGDYGLVVNESHVKILREKELICIWCNADQFMNKHKLNGFYSGMFISEVQEAEMYDVECSFYDVEKSNKMFSTLLGGCIDEDNRLTKMKKTYKLRGNKVADFNSNRLYETHK